MTPLRAPARGGSRKMKSASGISKSSTAEWIVSTFEVIDRVRSLDCDDALEQCGQRKRKETDAGEEIDREPFVSNARGVRGDQPQHRAKEMAIHLEKRIRRESICELIDADLDLDIAADQAAVDFPRFSFHWILCRLRADDFAFARQRHDAMRSHRVEADRVAVPMQTAAHPIVQRRRMERDRRVALQLSDSAQRFAEDALLRVKLRVEAQRGPVATAALVRDRTWRRAAQRTRDNDTHQLRARESLLHLGQPNDGDIAGIQICGEDREAIDARQRRRRRPAPAARW